MSDKMLPTIEQIESMEAGEQLDRLIAEHIMGWAWVERTYNRAVFGDPPPTYHIWWDKSVGMPPELCLTEKTNYMEEYTPPFSTDIETAWYVIESLQKRGLYIGFLTLEKEGWYFADVSDVQTDTHAEQRADSAPLVICKVALEARIRTQNNPYIVPW